MKMGTILIAAIMVFSIVPVAALAQSNGNGKPEWAGTYEDQKEQFEQAREQFKNKNMDEKQFTSQVQKYVGKSLDKMNDLAQKLRDRVRDTEFDLFLNQTRQRIINATNKAEVLDIAKDMKNDWKDFKIRAKQKINENVSDKINGIILNANGLARKLNATIQQLDARGMNTTGLKAEFAQFNVQINIAYGNWTLAHNMLKNYSNATDKEAAMDQMHVYLRNAQQALKQAHQILKDMAREIKGLIGKPIAHENETDDDEDHADTARPNLAMITPISNQNVSGAINVNVSASDNTNITSIFFKAGTNGTWYNMTIYAGTIVRGNWSASWNTNSTSDGTVVIFVIAKDYFNNSREINTSVNVNNSAQLNETDTSAPNVSIITPQPNQNVSGTIDVNVSTSDNTNVSSVTFKAGANGTLSNMSLYAGNVSSGRWYTIWDTNTTQNGVLTLFVTAKDYYNNSREISLVVYVNNTGQ
jgi:hypothetical protein